MNWFGSKSKTDRVDAGVRTSPGTADDVDVQRIIAGAHENTIESAELRRFMRSNKRHSFADGALGVSAYTFGALQHFSNQSSLLTLVSMWIAGTTFLVNYGIRRHFIDTTEQQLLTSIPHNHDGSVSATPPALASSELAAASPAASAVPRTSDGGVAGGRANSALTTTIVKEMSLDKKNIFKLEVVASWVWMLAAFQQFNTFQRLRWCGYSSWLGLTCVTYYSFRHIYNLVTV